ncbi:MAG: hypothetical protein RLZZ480_477 [Candidatus Parcubacteria bacterium]|jgi:uncharacterized protein (DUF305 family)
MKENMILIVAAAILVGGIGGYVIGNERGEWRGGMMGQYENREKDGWFSKDSDEGMHRMHDGSMMANDTSRGGMMQHGMMMVTSEKEFITEMIPHHQEAIDTAKEVLARGGTTPEVKTLAEGIVTAQEKEIADMKSWYETWYGTPYKASGNYKPMMRDLSKLSGAELDKAFLEDMIPHHMGAIMMAHSVQGYIEHDEMKTLTRNIVDSQSTEIGKMQSMLKGF